MDLMFALIVQRAFSNVEEGLNSKNFSLAPLAYSIAVDHLPLQERARPPLFAPFNKLQNFNYLHPPNNKLLSPSLATVF